MRFARIYEDCALAGAIEDIGREAFPPEEYVSPRSFLGDEEIAVIAMTEGETAVGYMCAGLYDGLTYLFFLAVAEGYRGEGRGAAALSELRSLRPGVPVIVDPELAGSGSENYEMRLRRRAFYLRNGFYPTGTGMRYNGVSFELLCTDRYFDTGVFRRYVEKYIDRGFDPEYFDLTET